MRPREVSWWTNSKPVAIAQIRQQHPDLPLDAPAILFQHQGCGHIPPERSKQAGLKITR
jgi:hypothetical protein